MAYLVNNKEFENREDFAKKGRGCGTRIPTPIDIMRIDEDIASNRSRRVLFNDLTIHVKFIHLTHGAKGLVRKEQREEQIAVLNRAYEGANLRFEYSETDVEFIANQAWYNVGPKSFEEREMKTKLSHNATKYLNFYTGGLSNGLLGWATFPYDLAGDPAIDGVVVLDESLPQGKQVDYNLGMTAVHEIGHWLGLYHTFQDGCYGFGDHIHDTPAHSSPNYGEPEDGKKWGACKTGEYAPIHNYMNYVNDSWMSELTDGQTRRIKEHIMMYRTGLLNSK